ncbi:hypothetical protein PV326_012228, partial [Microctonus aethiopoides]
MTKIAEIIAANVSSLHEVSFEKICENSLCYLIAKKLNYKSGIECQKKLRKIWKKNKAFKKEVADLIQEKQNFKKQENRNVIEVEENLDRLGESGEVVTHIVDVNSITTSPL